MNQYENDLKHIICRLGECLFYCRDLTHPDNGFKHDDEADALRFHVTTALNIAHAMLYVGESDALEGLKGLAEREAQ